ncbi:MAG: DUF1801 domain-containing protein [Verrucomicrobia bacterium]|nr:DUF1801 domain-containing protein [Verrucomicrobiota bacterium]
MSTKLPTPAEQLAGFIAKFSPKHQSLIRAVRKALRRRFPTLNEMVYDNYNFFVIGYAPTERPSGCFLSLAADAHGVSLCFIDGARLPDPARILLGSGKQTRFTRLASAADLQRPAIESLLTAAADLSPMPVPARGRGRLIIRSVATKQRPRQIPPPNPAPVRRTRTKTS